LPRSRGAFFLIRGRLVGLPAAPPLAAGAARSLSRSVWYGRVAPPPPLCNLATELAQRTPSLPGRVHALGRFEDEAGRRALGAALPRELAAALRPQFEWYGCRGAGFHTDAHYETVLFGAWCLAGPPREVVFAPSGPNLRCEVSDLVVFDPFQPHAVLDPGRGRYERDRYEQAPASLFLGFEIELTAPVCERFGIGPAEPEALAIGSATAVNAETGGIRR
jgi:hypothetical protein